MYLKNVYNLFPKKEHCIIYLEQIRWPHGIICQQCGSCHITTRSTDKRYVCQMCCTTFSVLTGTPLHNTRLPLQKWFVAIMHISNDKKISGLKLSEHLKINKNIARKLLMTITIALNQQNTVIRILVSDLSRLFNTTD